MFFLKQRHFYCLKNKCHNALLLQFQILQTLVRREEKTLLLYRMLQKGKDTTSDLFTLLYVLKFQPWKKFVQSSALWTLVVYLDCSDLIVIVDSCIINLYCFVLSFQ